MFGNSKVRHDLQEVKNWVMALKRSVDELHCKMFQRPSLCQCKAPTCIKECGVLTEENDGEETPTIEDVLVRLDDFFDDERVKKVETMLNELKGCIAMARASLMDKKEIEEMMAFVKKAAIDAERHRKESVEQTNYALTLHNQHFKIEAMYKMLMDMRDSKFPVKKAVRKKADGRKRAPTEV